MTTPRSSGRPTGSQPRAWGLRPRLVMLTWAVVVLSLLAGGAFAAFLLESREQASWRQRVAEAARGAAVDIRGFLEHAIDDTRALDLLGSEALSLNPELANVILGQHETFLEVSYLEPDGTQIAGASLDEPILGSPSAGSAPEWFEAARQGQTYYGQLEVAPDGEPFVVIAGPASLGRVIAARVQMTLLQELIEGLASPVEQTFVVDRQGRILAHVDPAARGQRFRAGNPLPDHADAGNERDLPRRLPGSSGASGALRSIADSGDPVGADHDDPAERGLCPSAADVGFHGSGSAGPGAGRRPCDVVAAERAGLPPFA